MRFDLVQDLLTVISELDRSPFPEGAAKSWMTILDGIDYADARQAVLEHYASASSRDGSGNVRRVLPADVRTGAHRIAEQRERALRRALPAAPRPRLGSTGRPAAVLAELAAARQRAEAATRKHREKLAAA
jgi:hypothetical protein